ncbi:MAG: excinuclease ABC subunit UvrC [Candidatus Eisenbacteria bacterium]|uniref:UvrABC system protein C n=1 Tax=Eiseniibacteriota bacterium TaxID=2212470 RepID=A0A538TYR9_UNCEI|nr:MAG: excinuclease ABC subunit UvrC [Candidatus Eisenbacteria bacterium]
MSGDNAHLRLGDLMSEARDLDVILTDSEVEALLLESTLVRQHRPHYNVLLKDDKSFPYVKVSVQEEFPRLSVTRKILPDGARYLGPFTDVKRLRRTLRELRRVFPVRTCVNFEDYRRANRPCLYYHIKRCVGPCYSRADVDPEAYRSLVDGLLLFLTGRDDELLGRLQREMEAAATDRRYEQAAQRRDQIRLLESMRVPQKVVTRRGAAADVLGVARHGRRAAVAILLVRGGRVVGKESRMLDGAGDMAEADLLATFIVQHYLAQATLPRRLVCGALPSEAGLLAEALTRRAGTRVTVVAPTRGLPRRLVAAAERNAALALEDLEARAAGRRARFATEVLELQRSLGIAAPPHRIACVDISNLGAEGAVAAVVASENGRPRKSLYRRMRVRRPGPDDFAMIEEAVERYWTRVESGELPRPDLLMVDGGAGQVSAARRALERASTRPVPLIGLAKREETVFREEAPPLRLARRSPSLRALQRLRDEAHRFGIAYHRHLRRRARVVSALDQVPGVGPARRRALLRAFGSVAALRDVQVEDVVARAAVPRAVAERVLEHVSGRGMREAPAAGPGPGMPGTTR